MASFYGSDQYYNSNRGHDGYENPTRRDASDLRHQNQSAQNNASGKCPRKRMDRQLSDKHLKRRSQLERGENGISNSTATIQHQQSYRKSSPSRHDIPLLPLEKIDQRQEQPFDHRPSRKYRRPKQGKFLFLTRLSAEEPNRPYVPNSILEEKDKKEIIILIALVLALILLVTIVEHSLLSSSFDEAAVEALAPLSLPDANEAIVNDYLPNDDNTYAEMTDSRRSQEDLTNTIRSIRIRRQQLRDNDDYKEDTEEDSEEMRLQYLELKIQQEQSEKVRQEVQMFPQRDLGPVETVHHEATDFKQFPQLPEKSHVTSTDPDHLLSESIAALKLVNNQQNVDEK